MTPDINKYSPKLIGPFSLRQCVSLGVALPAWFFTTMQATFLPMEYKMYLLLLFILFAFLFGWVRLYGMTFERFALHFFIQRQRPRKRLYRSVNEFREPDNHSVGTKKKKLTRKEKKKLAAMIEKYGGIN